MSKVRMARFFTGLLLSLLALLPPVLLTACSSPGAGTMHDGYYTAEAAEFDAHGWKEYITIYVKNNKIITVDYEAKNPSGFIKSWDLDYMRVMNAVSGTYPNEYVRLYSEALLSSQDPAAVDVVTGATHSHHTFQLLADAAIALARSGETNVAYVDIQEYE